MKKLSISRDSLYKAKGEIPCVIEYSIEGSLSMDSTLVEILKSNQGDLVKKVAFSEGDIEKCEN